MFLETEATSFAARFEVAAERITADLDRLESTLDTSIQSMADQLGWADYQLGDTESTLHSIQGLLASLSTETSDVTTRLRTLFLQDKREDPIRQRARARYVARLVDQIKDSEENLKHILAGGELSFGKDRKLPADVSEEDARELLAVAVKHLRDEDDLKKYTVSVQPIKNCSEADLDQFAGIVSTGGEVAAGVRDRVKRAHRLGFIRYDDELVGTAAIKRPAPTYRAKVFQKAKSDRAPSDYLYELGWIFLGLPHRKKGQMTRLLKELMPAAKGRAMFATTRTDNEVMKDMLGQLDFVRDGEDYPSEQANQMLQLYVRGGIGPG